MEYLLTDQMKEWARANGFNAEIHLDFFNDYLANKSGKPYRDMNAAFRNCVRCDWGGIRKASQMEKRFAPMTYTPRDDYIAPPITGEGMPDHVRAFLQSGGKR